jgi:hypothetical protein
LISNATSPTTAGRYVRSSRGVLDGRALAAKVVSLYRQRGAGSAILTGSLATILAVGGSTLAGRENKTEGARE